MDIVIVLSAKYLGYILLAIFLFLFWRNKNKDFFTIPLISALVSRFILTEVIRFFYFRPRPFIERGVIPLIEHASNASFPSGHAAFFFALSAGIYQYNKKAGLWFFALSAAIGLARVFAGVHYFTDVLGGLAIGVFSFWIVNFLFKKFV
ncbi:MAG: phosphatase PAP2 family protein [Parcubacteria group bacterium]|nr:phosphatase PAP2 family protein [Parcubacteria group bacterium]